MMLKEIYGQDQAPDIVGTNYTTNFTQQGKFYHMDMNLKLTKGIKLKHKNLKEIDLRLKEQLILAAPFCHPTISFKKTSLKYNYDTDYKYAQDLKLYIDNIFDCRYYYADIKTLDYTLTPEHINDKLIKRKLQLMLHDRAICALHRKVLGSEFDWRKSIWLRLRHVTNSAGIEDGTYSSILKNNILDEDLRIYYVKIRNKLMEKSLS